MSAAEELEERLRKREKKSEITHSELVTLLKHPYLDDWTEGGGKHPFIIRYKFNEAARKNARTFAEVIGMPKAEAIIKVPYKPISVHKGKVKFAYVLELLDLIEIRRQIEVLGLKKDLEDA